ncbi:MAG: hypothetical protein H8D82_01310 [Euryarchaeota archaeon]|nr:hypothetical protein [Euryarchaeota archaeon]
MHKQRKMQVEISARTITGNLLYRPPHLPRGVRSASSSNNYRQSSVQAPSLTKRSQECIIFEQLPALFCTDSIAYQEVSEVLHLRTITGSVLNRTPLG